MASAKEIQNRIKSVQDTMKITNAMFMIASSKLRKRPSRIMPRQSRTGTMIKDRINQAKTVRMAIWC